MITLIMSQTYTIRYVNTTVIKSLVDSIRDHITWLIQEQYEKFDNIVDESDYVIDTGWEDYVRNSTTNYCNCFEVNRDELNAYHYNMIINEYLEDSFESFITKSKRVKL